MLPKILKIPISSMTVTLGFYNYQTANYLLVYIMCKLNVNHIQLIYQHFDEDNVILEYDVLIKKKFTSGLSNGYHLFNFLS